MAVLVQWPPVHWGRGVIHHTIHTIPSIVTRPHYLLIPHCLVSLHLPISLAFTIHHHLRLHRSLYSALKLDTIPIRYCSHHLLLLVIIFFNVVSFLKGQSRHMKSPCYLCLCVSFISVFNHLSNFYKTWC